MAEETAKVKEAVGFATGDREVEAEGRAEREVSAERPSGEPTEEHVAQAKHEVRADHGDV